LDTELNEVSYNSDHPFPRYPNLVKGEAAARPDDIWVADITYVRLEQGFVYNRALSIWRC
jgi:hypothetical protein